MGMTIENQTETSFSLQEASRRVSEIIGVKDPQTMRKIYPKIDLFAELQNKAQNVKGELGRNYARKEDLNIGSLDEGGFEEGDLVLIFWDTGRFVDEDLEEKKGKKIRVELAILGRNLGKVHEISRYPVCELDREYGIALTPKVGARIGLPVRGPRAYPGTIANNRNIVVNVGSLGS